MNTETGEIKELTPEALELMKKVGEDTQVLAEEKLREYNKWKEIPVGKEIEIDGLHFVISHARVDTQEVILKPVSIDSHDKNDPKKITSNPVGKMKLTL